MTMREIAEILTNLGSEVKYTIRQDGGIRITYINGQKFSGSTGNTEARKIVGATISEARVQQLAKIRTPKGKWGHKKLDSVSDETKKYLRKIQRQYKKKGVKAGMPTLRLYRSNVKKFGKKEANRLLKESERYGRGLAYSEGINALIQRLESDNKKLQSPAIASLIERVKKMSADLRDDIMMGIYQELYKLETKQHTSPEDFVNRANAILDKN